MERMSDYAPLYALILAVGFLVSAAVAVYALIQLL